MKSTVARTRLGSGNRADAGRALEHAALLGGQARLAVYRSLAVHLARDVAPFAAYSTPVLPEFFSERVGCLVEQPVIGAVDIGAMCIRKS